MYYIGLDVHMKTISYCVKDAAGHVHQEGKVGSTRRELDAWIKTLPQPRMIAMEATIFTGWIYDHLLPHAEKVKVAHPLMLRAIAAAKKKNDKIDVRKIAGCLRCDFLPEYHMATIEIRDRGRILRYRNLVIKQMVQMKNRVSGLLMVTIQREWRSRVCRPIPACALVAPCWEWSSKRNTVPWLCSIKGCPCAVNRESHSQFPRFSVSVRTNLEPRRILNLRFQTQRHVNDSWST
jgi:hypothetical protein